MRIDPAHGRAPSRTVVWLSLFFLLVVWALNFVIGKVTLRYIPAFTLASFRLVLAGVFMLAIYPLGGRLRAFRESGSDRSLDRPPSNPAPRANATANAILPAVKALSSTNHESQLATHGLRDLWTFFYLSFFGVVVNQVCFTVGLHYTSVSHSAVIVGMGPIYALLFVVLLGLEPATLGKVLGMAIALVGVVLMAAGTDLGHRSPTLLGDLITLAGSLGFALYAALGKRVASRYDPLTMTTYNFVIGAILILPMAIYSARQLGPVPNWLAIPWQAWAGMCYMALFSSALAYLFYFWLLRYLEVTQLAAYNYLLPVTATFLGILFLNERGSWRELLGAAFALAGVYWIESNRTR